jgi:DNA-binding transcriptional ArsR family regulator
MNARERAAARIVELFDRPIFSALSEPARLDVLRVLLVDGASDIAAIAERLPQDRSVISRHLKTLHDAGVLKSHRDGRRVIYEIDGSHFIAELEAIVAEAKTLAPHCCPPTPARRPTRASTR